FLHHCAEKLFQRCKLRRCGSKSQTYHIPSDESSGLAMSKVLWGLKEQSPITFDQMHADTLPFVIVTLRPNKSQHPSCSNSSSFHTESVNRAKEVHSSNNFCCSLGLQELTNQCRGFLNLFNEGDSIIVIGFGKLQVPDKLLAVVRRSEERR